MFGGVCGGEEEVEEVEEPPEYVGEDGSDITIYAIVCQNLLYPYTELYRAVSVYETVESI